MHHEQDTIFAPASAAGRAGVSIIRVSGSKALQSLSALSVNEPKPRLATLATLRNPRSGDIVDKALTL